MGGKETIIAPETEYTLFIHQILQKSSEIANRNFGKVASITTKEGDNNQVLTETDLEIGNFIVKQIYKAFPTHNIIDEEAGVIDKNSEYTWIIDPIDGTSNFASGSPNYGTIVGLLKNDKPFAGGAALPAFGELVIAEKGRGAFCNGEKLSVTKENRLLSSLVAYAIDGHQENPQITYEEVKVLADIILGIRNLRAEGSIFDGIMVAKGKYGAFLNRTSKIWDNVGQQIIIEEAGGTCTDFFGQPQDYSNPPSKAKSNFTYCHGSPELHQQLQEIIHKAFEDKLDSD